MPLPDLETLQPVESAGPDFDTLKPVEEAPKPEEAPGALRRFGQTVLGGFKNIGESLFGPTPQVQPPDVAQQLTDPLTGLRGESGMEAGTEFTAGLPRDISEAASAVAKEPLRPLKRAWEITTNPLAEVVPKLVPQDLQKLLGAVSPSMRAAILRQRAIGGEPLPEDIITPEARKLTGVAAGVEQSLADTVNFFTSPLGIATLGMGALPTSVHAAVATAFALQMAAQVPEIARQLGDELGQPEEKRNYEKIASLITSAITTTGFTAAGGLGAIKQGAKLAAPYVEPAAARLEAALPARPKYPLFAEKQGALAGLPERAQLEATGRILPELPEEAVQIPPGVKFEDVAAIQTQLDARTAERLAAERRADEARMGAEKKERISKFNRDYYRMAAELRAEGNITLTRQEIIDRFPDEFAGLPNVRVKAGLVAEAAFGDKWRPTGRKAPDYPAELVPPTPPPSPTVEPKRPTAAPPAPEVAPPTAPDHVRAFEARTGFTFKPTAAFDERMLTDPSLTEEQRTMLKGLAEKGGWEFTDRRAPGTSTTSGVTFQVRKGATAAEIEAAYQRKLAEMRAQGGLPPEPTAAQGRTYAAEEAPQNLMAVVDEDKTVFRLAAPTSEIVVRPDVMQFKRRLAGDTKGLSPEHAKTIGGKWSATLGGLILVWEPIDPAKYGLTGEQKYIVANGHGRFNHALKTNQKNLNIQIMREVDGFSATDAFVQGALINIAEGKGTLYDQAVFLRKFSETHGKDKTIARAREFGFDTREAATVAFAATDPTFDAWTNGAISDEQIKAIVKASPNNEAGQNVGLVFARKVRDPDSLRSLIERALQSKGEKGDQLDLFGKDDSAINAAIENQKKAEKIMEDIREDINSMRSEKRSERAKKFGIHVEDKAAIEAKRAELEALLARWQTWWLDPELSKQITGVAAEQPPAAPQPPAPPVAGPPTPAPAPPAPTPGAPPTPAPTPPAAPAPAPTPPRPGAGKFGGEVGGALDRLKKKKPPQPPSAIAEERLQGVAEGRVVRPEAEVRELQAVAEGQAEMFPGERPSEEPLFEQATLRDLTIVGGDLIERGIVSYPEWYQAMTEAVGPDFKHYFRRAYNQVRDVTDLHDIAKTMTPREEVELYNDQGKKVGKGSKHRPGLVVRDEALIPKVPSRIKPTQWMGPEGDSLDYTQTLAGDIALESWIRGNSSMMIADGPGVGKSGMGAVIAHLMTFTRPVPLDQSMGKIWADATPEFKAKLLFGPERGGEMPSTPGLFATLEAFEPSAEQLDIAARTPWETLRPELKTKIYRKYGYTENQIKQDNVFADSKDRHKVLIVGTSKEQIETSFKPDFVKFGIPLDHIEFVTYSLLSNPGAEGTPQRALFDRITGTDWNAVIFDEAHALKNAGSSREHNSRKLKTGFKVFMTATPMDNTVNAVYFMSEITGQTQAQILDYLGLKRIVKTIGGEDREFVVQKPGISAEDVKERIIKLRSKAISEGRMIRREFPWWGDVVGSDRKLTIGFDAHERWEAATPEQRAKWIVTRPPVGAELPPTPGVFQTTEADIYQKWTNLRPEVRDKAIRNMGYSAEELESGLITRKGQQGLYWLENLDVGKFAEQQQIYDKWQEAIDKAHSNTLRKNLAGQRTMELKRWLETQKAKYVVPMIIKELEAQPGRNVVVYANLVNDHVVKGLGSKVYYEKDGSPQPDWVTFPGTLKTIAAELERLRIPFAQIFGSVKDVKMSGIRDFYSNRVRVALVTPESGGAGLNLDDVIGRYPRTLIVVDITFKGDSFEQLMYRVSRRNTASESKAHILSVPNGLADQDIRLKMNRKLAILRGIQAGEDTDLQTFIEDLNNEAQDKVPMRPPADTVAYKGELPVLNWELIRGKHGKIRYRARTNEAFNKWWDLNGGDSNPLGWRLQRGIAFGTDFVWADEKPDYSQKRPKEDAGNADPDLQATTLGGYANEPRFSGLSWEHLQESLSAYEALVADGVDLARTQPILDDLRRQNAWRTENDERTDLMLLEDAEFQELTRKIQENPDHPNVPDWEFQLGEIVRDTHSLVENRVPMEVPEAAVSSAVPTTVVPTTLTTTPKNMQEIIRNLRKGLGIPISYGSHIGGGFYDPQLNYARVKRVSDYPAAMHEAGHALDKTFSISSSPTLEAELMHLGDPARSGSRSSWTPGKSKAYQLGEGMAEFLRYWVTNPPEALKLGPNLNVFWEGLIDRNEELRFMRAIRDDVQTYQASPKEARFESRIVRGNPNKQGKTIADFISTALDELHVIKLASDDAFRGTGGQLRPSRDAYVLFRLLRGNFGRAAAWLLDGTVDAKTGDVRLGGSLLDAMRPVQKNYKEFTRYLVARQALEMMRQGKETGIPRDEISEVLNRYSANPEFQEAFDRVQKWQDALLRYSVDSGYLTETDYLRMKKENAIYVPMRRAYEVGAGEVPVGGGGTGRQLASGGKPSSYRFRKGGEWPIIDPVQSMVENAYFITQAVEKNRAMRALADYTSLPDMGKWIRPVPQPKERVQFTAGRIRSQLEAAGVDMSAVSDDTLLFFYREARALNLGDNTIRVKTGNQNLYYELAPDLYKAVNAMDRITIDGWMRWLAAPSQLLRAGVTLDPAFSLFRNIMRDTVSAAVISRYTLLPFEASIRGMTALLGQDIWRILGKQPKADAATTLIAEWKASGGDNAIEASYFDGNRIQQFIRDEMTKERNYAQRGLYWMKSPAMALRMLTQYGEQSTRLGEYQKVYNALKKQGWSNLDAHLQAAYEARDLQDFAMGGSSPAVRVAKLMTAFFNAGLQGNYRFFRALYDPRKPDLWKSTLLKGFGFITMAKMLEQYINWNNEDYWRQPRWQRLAAFHLPYRKDALGHWHFLLIPVPFEAGVIFASLPGAIMDFIKQKNPDTKWAFAKTFGSQALSNPIPQWAMLAVELMPELGFSTFQGRPLLGRGAERDPYWARYTDTTSLSARMLGRYLNIAPAKIEHVMRSTTGGVGRQVVHQGLDPLLEMLTGEKRAPVPATPFTSFESRPAGSQSAIVDDFYRKLGVLERESAARTKFKTKDPRIDLSSLDDMRAAQAEMSRRRKKMVGLRDPVKREQISLEIERIARRFVRTREGEFKSPRRQPTPAG